MQQFLQLQGGDAGLLALFVILSIWSLAWKGVSLWTAGGKKDKIWFIVLLIFNTLGILDILYIFIFSKMGKSTSTTKKRKTTTRKKKTE